MTAPLDGKAGSTRIERLVTRRSARCAVRGPTDPAAVRELWMVLHGYGQLAPAFLDSFAALDDGSRLLIAPEALSRFYDAREDPSITGHRSAPVGASWMTREERLDEIADHVAWLAQAYAHFAHGLPGVPLTVLGFSQGATAASRFAAAGLAPVSRLVCWGGAIGPELSLDADAPLARAKVYVVMGDRDRLISPAQAAAERARLVAAGFPFTYLEFAGGHRLDSTLLARLAQGEV